ncbi:ADP-ribosylation factor family-domain-containing protein [Russula vinacea]|nr:ADP-ribosylation factor family-domain-containing protein [Russula vinacea]
MGQTRLTGSAKFLCSDVLRPGAPYSPLPSKSSSFSNGPFFTSLFQWISGLFFTKAAEIAVVGLQVVLVTSFAFSKWSEDVVPTVAFNFRKVRKGNIVLKIWDVAGQPKFRSMWERYCHGVDAIFVVDSTDDDKFETARFELHALLGQPSLSGVPLLVLGNKNDIHGHTDVQGLIRAL